MNFIDISSKTYISTKIIVLIGAYFHGEDIYRDTLMPLHGYEAKIMVNKLIESLLDTQVYNEVFDTLAHFNCKLTNSNARGSIRVAKEYSKPLPYACVASAHAASVDIPLDYTRGAKDAKAFKHLQHARREIDIDHLKKLESSVLSSTNKKTKAKDSASLKDLQERNEAKVHFAKVGEIYQAIPDQTRHRDLDAIDPRMPQILLPKNGEYIAVTPIASSGFSVHVNKLSRGLGLKQAHRSIGGKNSQNVGGLVYAITKGIVTSAPSEDTSIARLYRLVYKGPRYKVPPHIFKEYIAWRASIRDQGLSMEHNAKIKEADRRFVIRLAVPFFQFLRECREFFLEHKEQLPDIATEPLKEFHAACLHYCLTHTMNRDSCKAIAEEIIWEISRYKHYETKAQVSWTQSEILRFIKIVAEALYV